LIEHIKNKGIKVGLSLKPATDIKSITPYLNDLDLVLITPYLNDLDLVLVMSVEPGFGGQSFMEGSLSKIKALRAFKETHDNSYLISVDGGIDLKSAPRVIKSGADVLVSGSAIFNAENPEKRP